MYLTVVNILFCIIALLMAGLFSLRVFFDKPFVKQSAFVALIGGMFIFYVLLGFVLTVLLPGLLQKLIIFVFAISPFIIGRVVSYKKLKIYSIIQILCVIFSIVFVIII